MSEKESLEEELAQQVGSLDDLQAEYDAGDLDQADYEALRADYTVRVADTMRRIENEPTTTTPESGGRRFNLMAIAGVLVFAVVAGWLLARSTGERGVNDILTGSIDSSRQRIFGCQELAAANQIVESLECLDGVLLDDPDNVEALTYRGWYLVLTTSSADAAGNVEQADELLETGLTYLDQAVAVDPTFPDARAFRAVVFDRQEKAQEACTEVEALIELDPPPFFVQQTQAIVDRNC